MSQLPAGSMLPMGSLSPLSQTPSLGFAPTPATPAAAPSFRRGGSGVKRRRRSLWLSLLRRAALPALVVGTPALVAGWLLEAPQFGLAEITVESHNRVPETWVRQALQPLAGENLIRLSLPAVDARLRQHPWVAAVEIHKQLPRGLRIALTERQPAAIVAMGGQSFWVESDGHLITPLAPGETPESSGGALPLVKLDGAGLDTLEDHVPAVPAALAVLAELARRQPGWAAGLIAITAHSEDDFSIQTSALPFPFLVRADEVGAKTQMLATLLPQILARYERLETVDLRFSRRIVLVPGAASEAAGEDGEGTAEALPAITHELGQQEVPEDGQAATVLRGN